MEGALKGDWSLTIPLPGPFGHGWVSRTQEGEASVSLGVRLDIRGEQASGEGLRGGIRSHSGGQGVAQKCEYAWNLFLN